MKIHYVWESSLNQYSDYTDEEFSETIEYDYKVDFDDLKKALIDIFFKIYKISRNTAENIISDLDLYEILEDAFEDELKDYFEDKAYEECFK